MDDCGFHNVWDIVLYDNIILSDDNALNNFFHTTLKKYEFKVLGQLCHKFCSGGQGVTGLFLLSESHLSFHTYPETNYISIDIYTCGKNAPGMHHDIEKFFYNSKRFVFRNIARGSQVSAWNCKEDKHNAANK